MAAPLGNPQSPTAAAATAAPALALSGTSLRWALGLFCSFIGALLLVAPHQFAAPIYQPLRSFGVVWAVAALAAGGGLLSAAALRTRRIVRLLSHGLASLVLLALAASLAAAGAWAGLIVYAVLAGALLTPAGLRGRPPRGAAGDLLALSMGLVLALIGALLALLPGLFREPWSGFGSAQRPLGLALLGAGLPICYVQLRSVPRRLLWAAHLAAGAGLVTLGVLAAAPPAAWTGIALFWGVGGAVTLLPWLREWWGGIDTSALRTRLALALATATCVSLVLAVAVSTTQAERLATTQASETLGIEARSVAQNVRDYVELNGSRATTMAALAAQLPLRPPDVELQRQLMDKSRPGYGDVTGMLLLGPDGRVVASDGGALPDPATLADVARATDRLPGRRLWQPARSRQRVGGRRVAAAGRLGSARKGGVLAGGRSRPGPPGGGRSRPGPLGGFCRPLGGL